VGPAPPASARVTLPQGAGIVSELHSQALLDAKNLPAGSFSDPVLFNNIIWQNRACYLDGQLTLFGTNGCESPGLPSAGFIDLEVLGGGPYTRVTNNLCTATGPNCPAPANSASAGNPGFDTPIETTFSALAFGGDPTFVTVIMRSKPSDAQGDYHITGGPAVDAGAASAFSVAAPCDDFDGDGRPFGTAWDIGADEQPGSIAGCPAIPVQLYFSTGGGTLVPGVAAPYDNADIYSWNAFSFARVFDASAVGLAGGADIDALLVVDSDTFYMSFSTNGGTTVPSPVGTAQDEDIVKYDAGTWSLYFDGSDAGVDLDDSNDEDVDAFEILNGGVIVSTVGDPDVPGISAPPEQAEDLLKCAGSFGPTTTCTWSFYFDGSDVGLTTPPGGENVDGASVDGGDLYLTTTGGFTANGSFSGDNNDVFKCNSVGPGAATTCSGFFLFFDASANGISDNIDAIDRPGARKATE